MASENTDRQWGGLQGFLNRTPVETKSTNVLKIDSESIVSFTTEEVSERIKDTHLIQKRNTPKLLHVPVEGD